MPVIFKQVVEPCSTPFCKLPATHFVRKIGIEYHCCREHAENLYKAIAASGKECFLGRIGSGYDYEDNDTGGIAP